MTACACARRGNQVIRPCLLHYALLSEIDQRRLRAALGITTVADRRKR